MFVASLPSRAQRAYGVGDISIQNGRLSRFFQKGSLKMLRPKRDANDVVLINTSGGLTGGDDFKFSALIGEGSELTVTTQAAERVYQSTDGAANVINNIEISADAHCSWIPQETIIYNHGHLARALNVNIEKRGKFLGVETLVFGRHAMGETIDKINLSDRWHITYDNSPAYIEQLKIESPEQLSSPFGFAGAKAMSNLVYIGEDAKHKLEPIRSILEKVSTLGAASAWNNNLVIRLLGHDARILRQDLITILRALNNKPIPQVWRS